jgi:hypothetical protein
MNRLNLTIPLFGLLCLANIAGSSAATIDPYKGRWQVNMERTLENLRKVAPQNIPADGFPAVVVNSMKKMSLEIRSKRYVFRVGTRKVINSRFEIISLSDEGVMMRIYVKNKAREQLLSLSPGGGLRVIVMNNGTPEPRAFANHFFWHRIAGRKHPLNRKKPNLKPVR